MEETETVKTTDYNTHYCVIIPTYNNCKTLQRVIEGVLQHTSNVIIVNDGATDATPQILAQYSQLEIINLPENRGKGNALRKGFKHAEGLGYNFAITIDSDGQHFPEDIPVFLNTLQASQNKNIILIGARNMGQADVPKKSSFGNKFSNFWYWFETGIRLTDTQSGFRLYPLKPLGKLNFYTRKFEFEIEVIVKAAWTGTEVRNVPVQISYDADERVSHFRPFKDFTRISILNTWFVIIALFYIKPRDLIRKLKKKGFKRFIVEDFLGNQDSAHKKALSIALGVFIGLSPLWGFHTLVVIFLAIVFKLNKVIAFAFSNVSLPPFIPFVIALSFKAGSLVLGEEFSFSYENLNENFEVIKHLKVYIVGSITLAITAAVTFGLLGFVFLTLFEKKKLQPHG